MKLEELEKRSPPVAFYLYTRGKTLREIAKEFGCTYQNIAEQLNTYYKKDYIKIQKQRSENKYHNFSCKICNRTTTKLKTLNKTYCSKECSSQGRKLPTKTVEEKRALWREHMKDYYRTKRGKENIKRNVQEWQRKNPKKWAETVRKSRKKYFENNREKVLEYFRKRAKIYRSDPKNKIKENARHLFGYYKRIGKIKKQPCRDCNSTIRIQGHHTDYSKPLEVTWLCSLCHAREHKRLKKCNQYQIYSVDTHYNPKAEDLTRNRK